MTEDLDSQTPMPAVAVQANLVDEAANELETAPLVESDDAAASASEDPVVKESVAESDPLADLTATVAQLAAETAKHHQRATHRESVIDNLHSELETLRTGERRGTVRPLLVAIARVRDDLLRQAEELPTDFDATRAQKLLTSYADSLEITLEDYGVATYRPDVGDEFDPRRHKAVSSLPTSDPSLVRRVASVKRDGYLDVEAGLSLTQSGVIVYVGQTGAQADPAADVSEAPAAAAPGLTAPVAERTPDDAPAASAAITDVPLVPADGAVEPSVHEPIDG